MNDLKDKIAIITGGSGDIGAATAVRFSQEGAKAIVIADIAVAKAQEICSQIQLVQATKCLAVKIYKL